MGDKEIVHVTISYDDLALLCRMSRGAERADYAFVEDTPVKTINLKGAAAISAGAPFAKFMAIDEHQARRLFDHAAIGHRRYLSNACGEARLLSREPTIHQLERLLPGKPDDYPLKPLIADYTVLGASGLMRRARAERDPEEGGVPELPVPLRAEDLRRLLLWDAHARSAAAEAGFDLSSLTMAKGQIPEPPAAIGERFANLCTKLGGDRPPRATLFNGGEHEAVALLELEAEEAPPFLDALARAWVTEKHGRRWDAPLDIVAVVWKDDTPTGVTVLSDRDRFDELRRIVDGSREALLGLDAELSASIGQTTLTVRHTPSGPDMDLAISHILDALLCGARPLAAWRTHFLTPLYLDAAPAGDAWDTALTEDLGAFFLPAVDRLLGSDGAAPLESVRRSDPGLRIRVSSGDRAARELPIREIHLHSRGRTDFALEWIVEDRQGGELPAGPKRWRDYRDLAGTRWSLSSVLGVNRDARYLFSPEKARETKPNWSRVEIFDKSGKELAVVNFLCEERKGAFGSPIVEELLKALPGVENTRHSLLGDERAAVITSLVAFGHPPACDLGSTYARMRFVDAWAPDFEYSETTSRSETNAGAYLRFAPGGAYLVSDHSFSYLGFLGGQDYALKTVHDGHMAKQYHLLALLPQLYISALDRFSRRAQEIQARFASDAEGRTMDRIGVELDALFADSAHFRDAAWFDQVTSHVQGQELWRLILDSSRARAAWAGLQDRLDRAQGFWSERIDNRAENRTRALAGAAAPFALFFGISQAIGLFAPEDADTGLYTALLTLAVWVPLFWSRYLRLPTAERGGAGGRYAAVAIFFVPIFVVFLYALYRLAAG